MLPFLLAALVAEGEAVATPHNYLKGAAARRPCGAPDDAGEIVVCARDPEADRLHDPDREAPPKPPLKAQIALGGGATLGVGLRETALSLSTQKAAPNEPPRRFGNRPTITLTIPLPSAK